MPSPRTISEIKSSLLRPALTSHFEVRIPIPSKMIEREGNNKKSFLEYNNIQINSVSQDNLNLLCSEATLPGSNLATLEITNDFHGVTERHAYRRVYDDRIDLTFYIDADSYLPIKFFETWMKFCVDESVGQQSDKGSGSKDPSYFYRVRYPSEYICTQGLQVIKFERNYGNYLVYDFVNAFPISFSSIPVSYESSSLLKCTVSMSYIRYVLNYSDADPIDKGGNLTPEQQADINSIQFSSANVPDLPGLSGTGALSTGGIPGQVARSSGNTILEGDEIIGAINANQTPVESGLPYVGRNIGPLAP